MMFLVLGILAWFPCGWWAGSIFRHSNLAAHLGWNRKDEIRQRYLMVACGPFALFGFSLTVLIDGSECQGDKSYCQQYLQENRYPSWFGKSSDYDKICHPETSVTL